MNIHNPTTNNGLRALGLSAFLLSGALLLPTSNVLACDTTGGNWNAAGTWTNCGGGTPSTTDAVNVNSGTLNIDTIADAQSVVIAAGATVTFTGGSAFAVGDGGIRNSGSFDATGAGVITVAATLAVTPGTYNLTTGTFTLGGATFNTSAAVGAGLENDGTFTMGAGAVTTDTFRNGLTNPAAAFTVGSGGLEVTGTLYPNNGTMTLNGDLTLSGTNYQTGSMVPSGTGSIILSDAIHGIYPPVNLHNLTMATLSAPRNIGFNPGTVTATGTTALNGSSVANTISFSGAAATFTPGFTANFCSGNTIAGITCNAGAGSPAPIGASIDLSSDKPAIIFAKEIDLAH